MKGGGGKEAFNLVRFVDCTPWTIAPLHPLIRHLTSDTSLRDKFGGDLYVKILTFDLHPRKKIYWKKTNIHINKKFSLQNRWSNLNRYSFSCKILFEHYEPWIFWAVGMRDDEWALKIENETFRTKIIIMSLILGDQSSVRWLQRV